MTAKKSNRTSLYIGIFLILLSLPGVITTFTLPRIFGASEIPNSGIAGIVVDSSENIFLGLAPYSKIQVYGKDGNFIRHWPIKTLGGTFKLNLDSENHIQVISSRGKNILTYDEYGELLLESDYIYDYSTYDKMYSARSFRTTKGDFYEVNQILYPTITKNGNKASPIITQSFIHKICQGPWPSWFYWIAGIILIVHYSGWFRSSIDELNQKHTIK